MVVSKKSHFRRPWTSNMVNGPNHPWNLNNSTFIIFIDQFDKTDLEKVSIKDMQNLKTAFSHIDFRT